MKVDLNPANVETVDSQTLLCISQFHPPPPQATAGHLPCHSRGWVRHFQVLYCPGAGHLPTPQQFPSFWHARGFLSEYNHTDTLLAESLRSFLDKSGKRKQLFPTYLGRSKETLLAGYYTEGFTEKKADWLTKDRNKLKRVVKVCFRFYAGVWSLLIKPELHSEIGAIDVNQRLWGIESNFCSYYLKNIFFHIYKTIHNI